jgi:WD40 repeat protein
VKATVAAPPSPYKGLATFEDSDLDALLFFGREIDSEVIAANLMAARITVLYGPSGVGKSSVLRAGVAHRLRKEQEVEVVVFSTWTGDPSAALIEAVGGSGDSPVDALAEAAARAGGDLYLILDQFEECFLYHPRGGRFAAQLADVVNRPGLRVNVLIGMREDALARLDALKAAIPNLLANRLRLERLDRAAGKAAILGPIERYNTLVAPNDRIAIEPELVDEVLDEVTVGRVELSVAGRGLAAGGGDENRIEAPFLQLVLARLWDLEAERGSRTLRRATLRELGGAERIVENHLEHAMAELSPREKGAAAAMYHFLVTPSGTKIAHGVHDLAGYAAVDEGEAAHVLQRLTAERIVRASSENGPSTTRYEIFHDVLADAVLAWRTRFEADRRIEEQRRTHERRQRRLLVIGAAALLGLAVMAAVTVYALAQRSNARDQAAVAQIERKKAERQAGLAKERLKEAERQEAIANRTTKRARLAEKKAEQEKRKADIARFDALEQKALAQGNQRKAEHFAALAKQETEKEIQATATAKSQTRKAVQATATANRQKRLIRARELAASARALLDEDPEKSVRTALRAVAAFRLARRAPGVELEDTLRDGLLALRLKAKLPGAGPVRIAELSSDGSLVLVAGKGGARLFDRAHGLRVRRLLPSSDLSTATFSGDGRLVAAGGRDRSIHVWDAQSGALLYTLPHDGAVLSLAFSPNGRFLASGSSDGTARLWSVAGGLRLATFTHPKGIRGDDVRMVSFSPDSTRLLTVGGDRFARVFDVAGREPVTALDNTTVVNAARFSHGGDLVATGGSGIFVRIWNASTGQLRYPLRITPATTGSLNELAFSPDDRLLATAGSQDTTAKVWNLAEKSAVAILTVHRSGIESVAFSPNGRSVVTAGRDGKAYIAQSEFSTTQGVLIGHRGPVNVATFSPDGSEVVTASNDGFARIWDAEVDPNAPGPLARFRQIGTHILPVNAVAFSPDGRLALSAGDDRTARVWGPGSRVVTLDHAGAVDAASFSSDSRLVITGSDDGTARVWRAEDGGIVSTLRHGEPVNTARLSPDGRFAVTAGGKGSAVLWNVRRGIALHRLEHGANVRDARFSPNGRLVVTASADGTAAVWRVADGHRVARLVGHTDDVVAAAFSPNGKRVATASADGTARIWSVGSGSSEHELLGHTDALTSLAFSPNGMWLATGSLDDDARIWNVRSGNEVAVLRVHVNDVNDVDFSFDSRWIATAGPGAAGIWETRQQGAWRALPLYLSRGPTKPINDLAFSRRGWRLIYGSRDGGVRTFDCRLCGGMKQLTGIARARLREIVLAKALAR